MKRLFLPCALLLGLLLSCGDDDDDDDDDDNCIDGTTCDCEGDDCGDPVDNNNSNNVPGGIVETALSPEEAGQAGHRMDGPWAMLINVATKQTGIPLVSTQVAASRNWYLVDLEGDGNGNYTAHEKLCGVKIMSELHPLSEVIVPQSFIDAIEPMDRNTTVTIPEEESSKWSSEVLYEVRGVNLENPLTDPLPANSTADEDSSIPCDDADFGVPCDQDEDGHPGLTNTLSGALNCKTYITHRWRSQLEGNIVDMNAIEGSIPISHAEQTIVAFSQPSCDPKETTTVAIDEKCPANFYFKMVRLKEGSNCETVLSLTSCYEDMANCDQNTEYPLNPNPDQLANCKSN